MTDTKILSIEEYRTQEEKDRLEWEQAEARNAEIWEYCKTHKKRARKILRKMGRTDLWFLCTKILKMDFLYSVEKPYWLFKRCQEIQADPNGNLDIWAREHFKSTLITFARTIQDILIDPEVTIGIFSFNRPIAKKFLIQIKTELETNELLKRLYSDILWDDPRRQAMKYGFKWSENEGITVKRKSNPKEATIEAWGLTDGQPTSKHFRGRIYDDCVTLDSVTNPEMIKKVTEAWEMSINLGQDGGWERYIGTFYHYNDTYRTMIDRGAVKLRKFPCFHNGKENGVNVLQSKAYLKKKRLAMGGYVFSSQMLCDPKEEGAMGFKKDWLKFWGGESRKNMNIYIFVDPASKKNASSDYTTMWVIGLGSDQNFYVLDMIRDKLSLTERAKTLFRLHREYRPQNVFYERYGLQADTEHFEFCMELQNYRFDITEVGGSMKKEQRIQALVPVFENGRLWLLEHCIKADYTGEVADLTQVFINEEYLSFPFSKHDDMLDSLARITDQAVELIWPENIVYGDTFFEPREAVDDYEEDILRVGL